MGQKQDLAQQEGRTLFVNTVVPVPTEPRNSKLRVPLHALVWAGHNAKISGLLEKGRWRDMPILSLTLQERATCPSTCQQWKHCYGDNMVFARRLQHGPELEAALETDVISLDAVYPEGFLIRLHVLGDFYSVAYVRFWKRMVKNYACRLYGYTHRQYDTPIGFEITDLVIANPDRVAIMRSEPTVLGDPLPAAWVVDRKATEGKLGSVVCPQETGLTESCGTCGLCMNGKTSVSFLNHSHAAVNAEQWEKRRELKVLETKEVAA
jgi:hypothetical protein